MTFRCRTPGSEAHPVGEASAAGVGVACCLRSREGRGWGARFNRAFDDYILRLMRHSIKLEAEEGLFGLSRGQPRGGNLKSPTWFHSPPRT